MPCWAPRPGYSPGFPYECGNDECYKIADPADEVEGATVAGGAGPGGFFNLGAPEVVVIGAVVVVCLVGAMVVLLGWNVGAMEVSESFQFSFTSFYLF